MQPKSKDPLLLQPNVSVREVRVSDISAGDTILCPDGLVRTVSKKDVRKDPFMGTSIFGDSYCSGSKPVFKVFISRVLS